MNVDTEEVTLGSYADPNSTTYENVYQFLQDVKRATLPEIVGATLGAWAVCHGVVRRLISEGHVIIDQEAHPWVYVWK
jgi:hypothetical protein